MTTTITQRGTVKHIREDRGFGFIRHEGQDVFFHVRDLAEGLEFDETLQERVVEFEIVQTDRGARAHNVRAAV